MKRRILLAAGLIGILLVSVLAFTGCDMSWLTEEPEGKITIINKMDYTNGGVWNSITVVITEEEGGKVVAKKTIAENKSESFTLKPNDYIITAEAISPLLGTFTGTQKCSLYNRSDKKYEVKQYLGLILSFIAK